MSKFKHGNVKNVNVNVKILIILNFTLKMSNPMSNVKAPNDKCQNLVYQSPTTDMSYTSLIIYLLLSFGSSLSCTCVCAGVLNHFVPAHIITKNLYRTVSTSKP